MGCGASAVQAGSEEDQRRNKEIDKNLRKDKKSRILKMLLLGAGESGKSTISKQFAMINGCFSDKDFLQHKMILHANAIDFTKILIRQAEKEGLTIDNSKSSQKERVLALQPYSTSFTTEIAEDIKSLLECDSIQDCLSRRREFGLPEASVYVFSKLDEIAKPDYSPSVDDCLHCRQRTSGVIETKLTYKGTEFMMVDVGGQRTERRKWIRCFEDVTVLLFIIACDEYDMTLMEDNEVNRMEESMAVLADLADSPSLSKVPFILFLNKKDLFERKIKETDLNVLFPGYTGGKDYANAMAYLKEQYTAQAKEGNASRPLFIYETCAVDRSNIEKVWNALVDIVTQQALKVANLAA
mmetsp:Transcript_45827/g.115407  ORF Transcript_45827/g.115407 Transcript_45827/m.115407 type:complete len:354 (+) Transcript_45827:199-1260(+)